MLNYNTDLFIFGILRIVSLTKLYLFIFGILRIVSLTKLYLFVMFWQFLLILFIVNLSSYIFIAFYSLYGVYRSLFCLYIGLTILACEASRPGLGQEGEGIIPQYCNGTPGFTPTHNTDFSQTPPPPPPLNTHQKKDLGFFAGPPNFFKNIKFFFTFQGFRWRLKKYVKL